MDARNTPSKTVVGVISDTHGAVSSQALKALEGVDHILHAGDIVGDDVIDALSRIAPVSAVRGNMDCGKSCAQLPLTRMVDLGPASFYLLHNVDTLDLDPDAAGVAAVVHGHTHRAGISWLRKVLYFNPGSARGAGGTVGHLVISEKGIAPRIIGLDP